MLSVLSAFVTVGSLMSSSHVYANDFQSLRGTVVVQHRVNGTLVHKDTGDAIPRFRHAFKRLAELREEEARLLPERGASRETLMRYIELLKKNMAEKHRLDEELLNAYKVLNENGIRAIDFVR